jgi:hypothetical protein
MARRHRWAHGHRPPASGAATGVRKRALFAAAAVVFVVTRAYILFDFTPRASDVSVYFSNEVRATDLRQTPYGRDLPIEFPPLAWWAMAMPRFVADVSVAPGSDAAAIGPARMRYTTIFRTEMCVFDLAAFMLFVLIVRCRSPQALGGAMLIYTAATASLAHVLYDRLDAGVLLAFMLAAYCWLRSIDPRASVAWTAAAYAALGLGVGYKIIPIIALPFLLLAELKTPRPMRTFALAALSIAVTLGGPFAIQYHLSGPGVFHLIAFHAERGVQVESLYATAMAVGQLFGSPVAITLWEGGADLSGALAPVMKATSTITLALFLAGLFAWNVRHFARYDRVHAYRTMCLTLAGAVILSNVLSPQYFIWALPLAWLLSLEVLAPARPKLWLAGGVLVSVAWLTAWVFPDHFFDFVATPYGLEVTATSNFSSPSAWTFALLGFRNLTYLAVVVTLGAAGLMPPKAMIASAATPSAAKKNGSAGAPRMPPQ